MEKQHEEQAIQADKKTWRTSDIRVSIPEMLVVILTIVLINIMCFFIYFNTPGGSIVGRQTSAGIQGTEVVDYAKYQTVWFETPEEPGMAFAVKIKDPAAIYMMGYFDAKLSKDRIMTERRLDEIQAEIRRLGESLGKDSKRGPGK